MTRIYDLTIEPIDRHYLKYYRLQYKNAFVTLHSYIIDDLFNTYEPQIVYNYIINQYFYENTPMLYEDYGCNQDYVYNENKYTKVKQKLLHGLQTTELTKKEIDKNKLKNNFWGSLIIEDIVDEYNV